MTFPSCSAANTSRRSRSTSSQPCPLTDKRLSVVAALCIGLISTVYGQRLICPPCGCEKFEIVSTKAYSPAPGVAGLSDGEYVVVWNNASYSHDPSFNGVAIRRYRAGGQVIPGDILVGNDSDGDPRYASAAVLPDGRFIVAWGRSENVHGTFMELFGQSGNRLGAEIKVSDHSNYKKPPGITPLSNNEFVFAWPSYKSASTYHLNAKIFNASGSTIHDFLIHGAAPKFWSNSLTKFHDGGIFAVYDVRGSSFNDWRAFVRCFDENGTPRSQPIPIQNSTSTSFVNPTSALLSTGNVVVVWQRQFERKRYILGQVYNAACQPQGPEFPVYNGTFISSRFARVAARKNGGFVTISREEYSSGDRLITVQRLDKRGTFEEITCDFNDDSSDESAADVAAISEGAFVLAWSEYGRGGSVIFVREFDIGDSPTTTTIAPTTTNAPMAQSKPLGASRLFKLASTTGSERLFTLPAIPEADSSIVTGLSTTVGLLLVTVLGLLTAFFVRRRWQQRTAQQEDLSAAELNHTTTAPDGEPSFLQQDTRYDSLPLSETASYYAPAPARTPTATFGPQSPTTMTMQTTGQSPSTYDNRPSRDTSDNPWTRPVPSQPYDNRPSSDVHEVAAPVQPQQPGMRRAHSPRRGASHQRNINTQVQLRRSRSRRGQSTGRISRSASASRGLTVPQISTDRQYDTLSLAPSGEAAQASFTQAPRPQYTIPISAQSGPPAAYGGMPAAWKHA